MPQHILTDQELVALLKEGNANAYTQLFDRYQPLLFVYACRITKDDDEAADIVQEVFLYLWDKKETIDLTGSILSYLYSAVRFKFFNLLDKKKVRLDYAESLKKFQQTASSTTDHQLIEREMLRLIQERVDLLPRKLKLIYQLSRNSNLSTAEIAEQLNLSEKTVQNNLSLAVRELKLRLGILQLSGLVIASEVFAELIKKI